jgi:hypothetical protein
MHPDEIIQLFREKWAGTASELATALDAFYSDIRNSVVMLDVKEPLVDMVIVDDYVGNHYGEDNIPT